MRNVVSAMLVLLAALGPTASAPAYIGSYPTLGKLTADSDRIVVLEVDRVSREKQVVLFKKVADLKGKGAAEVAKHQLTDGFHPRQAHAVLDWAEPGAIAVCFQTDRVSLTCIGDFWYECAAGEAPWWTMTAGRPELSYIYSGSTSKLRGHVTAMLAGRETVITALKYRALVREPGGAVRHDIRQWDANEAVGARRLMRGKDWPLCRIRAGLKMPNTVPELILDSDRILGDGPGGPEDVPALVKALRQAAAAGRVEAAEDLGRIGPPAAAALPALRPLTEKAADPLLRVEAARAVASIDPKNQTVLPLLTDALMDGAARVRKRAAERLGDLGPAARSAVAALVKAAGDPDPAVRRAAIDALGQIGPDAEQAVAVLVEALRDASTRGAAVDALGLLGGKARAAAPALEKVLKGDDVAIRWAAAAALVRVGGPGAGAGVRHLLETATRDRARNWTDAGNILMAPTARAALPPLLEAVADPSVRELAVATAVDLSVYLANDPLADVKPLLQDKDAGVRCVAAWVLYCARAVEIKEAIAFQRDTLKAADPWARRQAAGFLGKLGRAAGDAAEDLSALVEEQRRGRPKGGRPGAEKRPREVTRRKRERAGASAGEGGRWPTDCYLESCGASGPSPAPWTAGGGATRSCCSSSWRDATKGPLPRSWSVTARSCSACAARCWATATPPRTPSRPRS
jgi:HEAT repeat protein